MKPEPVFVAESRTCDARSADPEGKHGAWRSAGTDRHGVVVAASHTGTRDIAQRVQALGVPFLARADRSPRGPMRSGPSIPIPMIRGLSRLPPVQTTLVRAGATEAKCCCFDSRAGEGKRHDFGEPRRGAAESSSRLLLIDATSQPELKRFSAAEPSGRHGVGLR